MGRVFRKTLFQRLLNLRFWAAFLLMTLSPFSVHAKPKIAASKKKTSSKWQLLVLEGDRLLNAGDRDSRVEPELTRESAVEKPVGRSDWSLQLGIVRPTTAMHHATFGLEPGVPVAGDFNGDGCAEIGVFAEGRWYLDMNGSGAWDDGDLLVTHGAAGDLPVVGDWNQDGKHDVGVYTPDQPHAVPVVGDWTGTGEDRIGLFADGVWHLDTNGDGDLTSADVMLQLGQAGDLPIVGDFNRDGSDELGVYRNGRWIMDAGGDRRLGDDDLVYVYGDAGDLPVIGDWDGDGRDQIGLVRGS